MFCIERTARHCKDRCAFNMMVFDIIKVVKSIWVSPKAFNTEPANTSVTPLPLSPPCYPTELSIVGIGSLIPIMVICNRISTRQKRAFTRLLVGCFRLRYRLIITGIPCFLVDVVVWCQPQRAQLQYSSHVASAVPVLPRLVEQLR